MMKIWVRNTFYVLVSIYRRLLMTVFSIIPIKNRVVFSSYKGKYYNDNPMCIYQEFIRREIPFEYVWLMNNPKIQIEGARVIKEGSIAALYTLATSKVWIDNCRKKEGIRKRKGQFYVQTWHADMAMKKVEKDAVDDLRPYYVRAAINDSKMADVFVSSSKWTTNNYRNSFWYDGRILESGSPRSDIFFTTPEPIRDKVLKYYNLNRKTKIILYAPTFRSDGNTGCYNINYDSLIKSISINEQWVIIVRLHPILAEKQNEISYSDKVLNGSKYPDINELIISSEVIITDYSSCMFDGMAANKKVIIYATDIEKYLNERGFYLRIDQMPFPITRTNEELVDKLLNFDNDEYNLNVSKFKNELGYVNDGHGAERVVNDILENIE